MWNSLIGCPPPPKSVHTTFWTGCPPPWDLVDAYSISSLPSAHTPTPIWHMCIKIEGNDKYKYFGASSDLSLSIKFNGELLLNTNVAWHHWRLVATHIEWELPVLLFTYIIGTCNFLGYRIIECKLSCIVHKVHSSECHTSHLYFPDNFMVPLLSWVYEK